MTGSIIPTLKRRPLLTAAFVLAMVLTIALGVRTAVRTVYWTIHAEEPIEPWMPLGYVANAHDVSPAVLQEALGLPVGARDRRPLAEIAEATGRSEAEILAILEAAIAAERGRGEDGAAPP